MTQVKKTNFINKHTSLEGVASKYSSITRVLYILSLLGVLVVAVVSSMSFFLESPGVFLLLFFLIIVGGYLVVTFMFGLSALLIQIHKNLEKLAEK